MPRGVQVLSPCMGRHILLMKSVETARSRLLPTRACFAELSCYARLFQQGALSCARLGIRSSQ
eukprot:scaffold117178_cov32-Prasinocladus_malaysianus.AAC.1